MGRPALLGTVELHCAGLGVMIYSPAAVTALRDGVDYMPAGAPLVEPLRALVEVEQRVVLLGTGSPQLDYLIRVQAGAARPSRTAASRARFGITVGGGALLFRDGYDPMEWHARSPHIGRVPVDDGDWVVQAAWIPDAEIDAMVIELSLVRARARRRLPKNGWPYLAYRVRR